MGSGSRADRGGDLSGDFGGKNCLCVCYVLDAGGILLYIYHIQLRQPASVPLNMRERQSSKYAFVRGTAGAEPHVQPLTERERNRWCV